MNATIDHGNGRFQCFTGTVNLNPQVGVGATTGTLVTQLGFSIPLRQIPGPDNRGIPLSQADGMFVNVCGQFITDISGTVLSVLVVTPR